MQTVLPKPKRFIITQKRCLYTGTLNQETSGDDNYVFLHFGDVDMDPDFPYARGAHIIYVVTIKLDAKRAFHGTCDSIQCMSKSILRQVSLHTTQ